MSNKKILIITRDFPPYSGRGSIMRILKFAKYLPEFGWQPFVVAEKKDEVQDSTLLQQLPSNVKIEYIYSQTPQKRKNEYKRRLEDEENLSLVQRIKYLYYRSIGYNVFSLYQNYLLAPDLGWFWAKEASGVALDLHNKHQFDVFLTSGPPFSTFRIGLQMKDVFKIPWVLDFRDSWVGNPIFKKSKLAIINWKNHRLEEQIIRKADFNVFATKPMQEDYSRKYPDKQKNMVTLTNGYDSQDISNITGNKDIDGKLHIVYSGTVSGRQEPTPFFKGLLKAIDNEPQIKDQISVSFIGKFKYQDQVLLGQLAPLVKIEGIHPHEEAIKLMAGANVFLLLINPTCGRTMMTGKIFEYLALKKPILAVSIPCAATDLIRENNAGYIADWHNHNEIANQLLKIYHDWRDNCLNRVIPDQVLKKYERRNLTATLSEHLDAL